MSLGLSLVLEGSLFPKALLFQTRNLMLLPMEIILQIFSEEMNSLFLLDKKFCREYFKRKLNSLNWHTGMPIFDNPMFPYYSFLRELYVSIYYLKEMKKWIRFPYSELTNCTKVEIGALHSEIDVDLKENLLVECYEKIRCQMPWLKKFATDRMVDSTMALEIFQNSNLTSIELGDISDNFYLVATMAGLNSLFIADPFNLKDFRCTLPNISKLEIVEFDQISNADLSEIFSNIPKVFPGIDALIIGLDVPEMLHFLPENIDKIEIILYSPISPNIPEDLVVNRLCVSVINICFDTDDLTPLRLVLNNANT